MLSNTKGKKEWSMKGPIVSIDVSKGMVLRQEKGLIK